jgi:AraC-like DNA-binding protein
MAEYRELAASPELAEDVACLWFDDRLRATQLVLPDGCIDIVWIRGQPPIVAGPATLPIVAAQAAPVLGMRFRPGRAPAFLGISADALLDCNVPLPNIWGDPAERLADALERSDSISEGLHALEEAVVVHRRGTPDSLVSAAVARLRRAPDVQVAQLGDTLGISERQLLRRFTSAVGYGPKVLGRVLRFQRFMHLLEDPRARAWDLARLAAEVGYADHAHLTRECNRLAGSVPSGLRGL